MSRNSDSIYDGDDPSSMEEYGETEPLSPSSTAVTRDRSAQGFSISASLQAQENTRQPTELRWNSRYGRLPEMRSVATQSGVPRAQNQPMLSPGSGQNPDSSPSGTGLSEFLRRRHEYRGLGSGNFGSMVGNENALSALNLQGSSALNLQGAPALNLQGAPAINLQGARTPSLFPEVDSSSRPWGAPSYCAEENTAVNMRDVRDDFSFQMRGRRGNEVVENSVRENFGSSSSGSNLAGTAERNFLSTTDLGRGRPDFLPSYHGEQELRQFNPYGDPPPNWSAPDSSNWLSVNGAPTRSRGNPIPNASPTPPQHWLRSDFSARPLFNPYQNVMAPPSVDPADRQAPSHFYAPERTHQNDTVPAIEMNQSQTAASGLHLPTYMGTSSMLDSNPALFTRDHSSLARLPAAGPSSAGNSGASTVSRNVINLDSESDPDDVVEIAHPDPRIAMNAASEEASRELRERPGFRVPYRGRGHPYGSSRPRFRPTFVDSQPSAAGASGLHQGRALADSLTRNMTDQERADFELARSLQEEENSLSGLRSRRGIDAIADALSMFAAFSAEASDGRTERTERERRIGRLTQLRADDMAVPQDRRQRLQLAQRLAGRIPLAMRLATMDRDFNEEDYELLIQLDENTPSLRGAKPEDIHKLRTFTAAGDSQQCIVCLQEPEEGEAMRSLPCNHEFHKLCVDEWLATNAVCPICKKDIRDAN